MNYKVNDKNEEQLYKWLKSEPAYTSNNIERNTLIGKETRLVIEEDMTCAMGNFTKEEAGYNKFSKLKNK